MFVLLFAYVFGGAISVPGGGEYREFLMGGIFAQTVVFSAFGVALSLATDRRNQAIDRFRSVPIARGALLGWRINTGIVDALIGYALLAGFSFAMIWVGILLGSAISTPEGVTGLAFTVLFPITFMASTFVPTSTMPGILRVVAEWNPVTTLSDAARIQFGNPNTPIMPGDAWSISHPVAYTLIWIVGIIVISAPLAVRAYERSLTK